MSDGIVESKTVESEQKLVAISGRKLSGMKVVNLQNQDLGELYDIVIDLQCKCISYGVLAYGGFAGIRRKFFAIPWEAFSIKDGSAFLKESQHRLILNIPREALKESDGFDERNWPSTPDYEWLRQVYSRYGFKPYWE